MLRTNASQEQRTQSVKRNTKPVLPPSHAVCTIDEDWSFTIKASYSQAGEPTSATMDIHDNAASKSLLATGE